MARPSALVRVSPRTSTSPEMTCIQAWGVVSGGGDGELLLCLRVVGLGVEDFGVLADGGGAFAAIAGVEEGEFVGGAGEFLFLVARFAACFVWFEPDLVEFGLFGGGGIEFAVADAAGGAHVLQLAGSEDGSVAEAVAVFELTVYHEGENLHVGVGMSREAAVGLNGVVVHDPEGAEAHVVGVMIIGEGEGEASLQPSVVGLAAIFGWAFAESGGGWLFGHGGGVVGFVGGVVGFGGRSGGASGGTRGPFLAFVVEIHPFSFEAAEAGFFVKLLFFSIEAEGGDEFDFACLVFFGALGVTDDF